MTTTSSTVRDVVARVDPDRLTTDVIAEIGVLPAYWSLGADVLGTQMRAFGAAAAQLALGGYLGAMSSTARLRASVRDLAVLGVPAHDIAEAFVAAVTATRRAVEAQATDAQRAAILARDRAVVADVVEVSKELSAAAEGADLAAEERAAGQQLQGRLVPGAPGATSGKERRFAMVVSGAGAWAHAMRARELRHAGAVATTRSAGIAGVAAPALLAGVAGDGVAVIGDATDGRDDEGALDELLRLAVAVEARGGRAVVQLDDLLAERLLISTPALAAAVEARALAPLRDRTGAAGLIEALRALIDADLDYARAAAAVGVHANTLRNRIRRITTLTGLSPARPADFTILMLAAHLPV